MMQVVNHNDNNDDDDDDNDDYDDDGNNHKNYNDSDDSVSDFDSDDSDDDSYDSDDDDGDDASLDDPEEVLVRTEAGMEGEVEGLRREGRRGVKGEWKDGYWNLHLQGLQEKDKGRYFCKVRKEKQLGEPQK